MNMLDSNEVSEKKNLVRLKLQDISCGYWGILEMEFMFVFILISIYERINVQVCVGEGKEGMIGLSCY